MENWEWIVALLGGVALGALLVWAITKPKFPSEPTPLVYQNLEEWELERDEKGVLKGLKVHRNAKQL